MEGCRHGMDPVWCYLCRVEASGVEPSTAWGLDALERADAPGERRLDPMNESQAGHLRMLSEDLGAEFVDTLTEAEADLTIERLMNEPMTERQARTLAWFSGEAETPGSRLTYGEARTKIRRLVALRGLRSA